MSGAKNVPRPENCGRHLRRLNQALTFSGDFLVNFHHWRRLSDAYVNEMFDSTLSRSRDGRSDGNQIDLAELFRLRWTGMGHSDQLHKRVRRFDQRTECRFLERVTHDGFSAGW